MAVPVLRATPASSSPTTPAASKKYSSVKSVGGRPRPPQQALLEEGEREHPGEHGGHVERADLPGAAGARETVAEDERVPPLQDSAEVFEQADQFFRSEPGRADFKQTEAEETHRGTHLEADQTVDPGTPFSERAGEGTLAPPP